MIAEVEAERAMNRLRIDAENRAYRCRLAEAAWKLIIADPEDWDRNEGETCPQATARHAFELADAFIAETQKNP